MSWVKEALGALQQGKVARVRPLGGSMRGRIESGQLVTLEPPRRDLLQKGDAVLVRWRGGFLLHLIVDLEPTRVLIGNNLGKINGWAPRGDVLGVVTAVEP
ncbi:MAG: hypothetical protein MUF64_10360 [Polyangiaceae bacterium]|jgi:hypothetical protein|nr:hypothetical protein [Polyangiaceae bacterium]